MRVSKIFACVTIFVKTIRRGDSGISIIRTVIFDPFFDSKNHSTVRDEDGVSLVSWRLFFFFETKARRTLSKLKIYIELHFSLVSKHSSVSIYESYLNFDFLSNFRRRSLIFALLSEINFQDSVSRIHTKNDKSCLLINKKRKKRT